MHAQPREVGTSASRLPDEFVHILGHIYDLSIVKSDLWQEKRMWQGVGCTMATDTACYIGRGEWRGRTRGTGLVWRGGAGWEMILFVEQFDHTTY